VQPRQTSIFVSVLARELGAEVTLEELDDPTLRANVATLKSQGFFGVRVSSLSTVELALAVMTEIGLASFEAVVVCTDSLGETGPSDFVLDIQRAAHLDSTRTIFVSGGECANFVVGLDVATGLVATGAADPVLLVLVDRVIAGTRYTPVSDSAYSDGAVSCRVSATPGENSFRLMGSATETRLPRDATWGDLADARTTLAAMRTAATRAMDDDGSVSVRHVITLNLGDRARQLIAMAAPVPSGRLYSDSVRKHAHCFGADIPLNLDDLASSRLLTDGDGVLALATSRHAFSATLFRYIL
jgi:3-oxoacyl-[acyl-carrier-protein] synthase III